MKSRINHLNITGNVNVKAAIVFMVQCFCGLYMLRKLYIERKIENWNQTWIATDDSAFEHGAHVLPGVLPGYPNITHCLHAVKEQKLSAEFAVEYESDKATNCSIK